MLLTRSKYSFGLCNRRRSGKQPPVVTTTRSRDVQYRGEPAAPPVLPLRPGISSNERAYEKCIATGDPVKYGGYLTIISDDVAATHDRVTTPYENDQYASVSDYYEHSGEYQTVPDVWRLFPCCTLRRPITNSAELVLTVPITMEFVTVLEPFTNVYLCAVTFTVYCDINTAYFVRMSVLICYQWLNCLFCIYGEMHVQSYYRSSPRTSRAAFIRL